MSTTLRKIAEGREAEIFAWGDNAVLRLLRNPNAQAEIECEASAMRAAAGAGVRVPAVIEVTAVGGRPGLVMERIQGTDYLTVVGKQPWLVFSAGAANGRLQAALHEIRAPDDLPSLHDILRRKIEAQSVLSQELKSFALNALDALPRGARICHGDLHPGNIIRTNSEPVIIDWTNVAGGDPVADFVRTRLMIRIGDVPPGSPFVIRYGAKVARGLMLSSYNSAYRRVRPIDDALAKRWEVAVAAARVADGIESENPKLIAIVERARGA